MQHALFSTCEIDCRPGINYNEAILDSPRSLIVPLVHAADIALTFSSQALHQELRPMRDDQIERRIEAANEEGRNDKITSVLLLSRLLVRPWISCSLRPDLLHSRSRPLQAPGHASRCKKEEGSGASD